MTAGQTTCYDQPVFNEPVGGNRVYNPVPLHRAGLYKLVPPARPEDDYGTAMYAIDLAERWGSIGHCGWASWYEPHCANPRIRYGIVVDVRVGPILLGIELEDFDQVCRSSLVLPRAHPVRAWY